MKNGNKTAADFDCPLCGHLPEWSDQTPTPVLRAVGFFLSKEAVNNTNALWLHENILSKSKFTVDFFSADLNCFQRLTNAPRLIRVIICMRCIDQLKNMINKTSFALPFSSSRSFLSPCLPLYCGRCEEFLEGNTIGGEEQAASVFVKREAINQRNSWEISGYHKDFLNREALMALELLRPVHDGGEYFHVALCRRCINYLHEEGERLGPPTRRSPPSIVAAGSGGMLCARCGKPPEVRRVKIQEPPRLLATTMHVDVNLINARNAWVRQRLIDQEHKILQGLNNPAFLYAISEYGPLSSPGHLDIILCERCIRELYDSIKNPPNWEVAPQLVQAFHQDQDSIFPCPRCEQAPTLPPVDVHIHRAVSEGNTGYKSIADIPLWYESRVCAVPLCRPCVEELHRQIICLLE